MARLLLLGLLFNGVVLVSNPSDPGPQDEYKVLLQKKRALEQQQQLLELEESLVAESLQDSAVYLVVDLNARQVTVKLGGVPLRSAPILWRYGRPGHEAVSGVFQVAERMATVTGLDSLLADSLRTLHQRLARKDTVRTDKFQDESPLLLRAPQLVDPQRRYRLSLQGGPELWLASLSPGESRMDTLKTRLRAWLRDLPASVEKQSLHLVVAPADAHWIFSMAALGTRVLVVPSS